MILGKARDRLDRGAENDSVVRSRGPWARRAPVRREHERGAAIGACSERPGTTTPLSTPDKDRT